MFDAFISTPLKLNVHMDLGGFSVFEMNLIYLYISRDSLVKRLLKVDLKCSLNIV